MKRVIEYLCSVKGRIELLWSVMGGLLFSLLPMIISGSFNIRRWWRLMKLDLFYWSGSQTIFDEFVVGFIFTFILVKSIRRYKETN